MQIFEVRSFDYLGYPDGPRLQDDLHPRSPSWSEFVECNQAVLLALKGQSLPAPENHALVATLITHPIVKDGHYYFSSSSANRVEVKAGELAFSNNHLQIWLRDAEGRGKLFVCSLFHEQTISMALAGNFSGLQELIRDRATANLERKLAERQEETRKHIAQLGELLDAEHLVDHQLRLLLKHR